MQCPGCLVFKEIGTAQTCELTKLLYSSRIPPRSTAKSSFDRVRRVSVSISRQPGNQQRVTHGEGFIGTANSQYFDRLSEVIAPSQITAEIRVLLA